MKTLMISILGTSWLRPKKVAIKTRPEVIYLVKSSQNDWNAFTTKLAAHLSKEILTELECEIKITEAILIDFDSVFQTIYRIIADFRKDRKGRMPIHIDVSATTGVAMMAAYLAASLFDDVHLHYVHAIFNPESMLKAIEEEDEKKGKVSQSIMEIPKPLVPIFTDPKNEIHKKTLMILHEENGILPSSSILAQKLGRDRKTKRSNASTIGSYVKYLRKWGLVEKERGKGNAEEVKLTRFGESLARILTKLD